MFEGNTADPQRCGDADPTDPDVAISGHLNPPTSLAGQGILLDGTGEVQFEQHHVAAVPCRSLRHPNECGECTVTALLL